MNYCKTRLLPDTATSFNRPIGGDWFAITTNKAQGQTLQCVGIDLRFDSFSHGQSYVGLSRTGNSENQFILLSHGL